MSRFDDYERRGDYLIPSDTLEEAEREFQKRSPRSRALDRALHGPITTDYEKWKSLRGRGVDFPGVDTPTSEPRMGVSDHLGPMERGRLAHGSPQVRGEVLLVEDPAARRGQSVTDSISDIAEEIWDASGRFANVAKPGTVPRE